MLDAALIHVSGMLTLGELIVGVGTGALAVFTHQLARASYKLDDRSAARDIEQRLQRVRGIARLVDGELGVVAKSVRAALLSRAWWSYYPIPTAAWEQHSALICEILPEEETRDLIALFSSIIMWRSAVEGWLLQAHDEGHMPLDGDRTEVLADLSETLSRARAHLKALAAFATCRVAKAMVPACSASRERCHVPVGV
jgi:hypothetical protein